MAVRQQDEETVLEIHHLLDHRRTYPQPVDHYPPLNKSIDFGPILLYEERV